MKKIFYSILVISLFSCNTANVNKEDRVLIGHDRTTQKDLYPKISLKVDNKENKINYGENNIILISGKQVDLKHVTLTASTGILVKINKGWIYKTNTKVDDVVRFTAKGVSSFGRNVSAKFDFRIWGLPEQ